MISKMQAIQNLVPGAEVSIAIGNGEVTWLNPSVAPVTEDQITAEQQRLQDDYDWNEYRRNRAREYPSIEEQLDALYHAGVFPPEMTAKIRAVKIKYPQPTMNREEWLQNQIKTPSQPVYQSPPILPVTSPVITEPTPSMSVEEWLAQEQKMSREQWLEQQKTAVQPPQMTREQWLAEQAKIK
jgi:hypothetical protein